MPQQTFTSLEDLLTQLASSISSDPASVQALESYAGMPVILEAKQGGARGINLDIFTKIFGALGPFLGKLAPAVPIIVSLITTISTGGLTAGTFLALLPDLLKIFGLSQSDTQQVVSAVQASLQGP